MDVSLGFCVHAKSLQLCLTLCDPWTVACQAPPSMGFSRQEFWSGLPCPSPGDLLDPGMEPKNLMSPIYWLAGSLPTSTSCASGLVLRETKLNLRCKVNLNTSLQDNQHSNSSGSRHL